ncbi:MAG: zf-HC2 domain-containing protein [Candidatus Hydrogenedentes bacterium]|nr:zf-HC2 domain-containing protein [Candidatus Hydrogenedentota bacterium]
MNREECTKYRDRLPALAENPLGPEAEPSLLAHIRACPHCAAEYAWLASLCGELESMGDTAVKTVPAVDLTDNVMKAVARLKRPRLVELAPARPRNQRRFGPAWWVAASAAAAAILVAAVWIAGYRATRPQAPSLAVQTPSGPVAPGEARVEPFKLARTDQSPAEPVAASPFQKLIDEMRPSSAATPDVVPETQASLSVHEVLAARKDAITNPAARLQLARWAEIAVEKARKLAADPDLAMGAKIGAAESLPPDEAEKILLAAVQADPDNPYLRSALGNTYTQEADGAPKAAAEFAAQAQLDPNNALAYYQLAASLFAQGDAEGAASALETAQSLAEANPYTQQAAGFQEQALAETGVAEEVARLLVALTAGTSQYGDLVGLGSQLIDYGKYYEQNGQTALAEQIYNSVRIFGEQLAGNAVFANELLAGLDIQREAVSVLAGLVEFMQEPQNVQLLAGQSENLFDALNSIGSFFTSLNDFFRDELGADVIAAFVDFVLGNGDLDVLDFLGNAAGL